MLKIRLQRFGKKNQPIFRIVLVDSHKGPKSGSFLEVLGLYNPHTKETTLKSERILHWIGEGAQASDTMNNLLIKNGVIKGSKIDVSSKKNAGKDKEEEILDEKEKVELSDNPASSESEEEAPKKAEASTEVLPTGGEVKETEELSETKESKESETKTEISSTTNEKEKN